jgi:hypothetical protein
MKSHDAVLADSALASAHDQALLSPGRASDDECQYGTSCMRGCVSGPTRPIPNVDITTSIWDNILVNCD